MDAVTLEENLHFTDAGEISEYAVSAMNWADKIIEQLLNNKLLDTSVKGSTGILLCITASSDTGLDEIDKISTAISEEAQRNATIIFGIDFDDNMQDEMQAILIATKKECQVQV